MNSEQFLNEAITLLPEQGVIIMSGKPLPELSPTGYAYKRPSANNNTEKSEVSPWGESNDFPQKIIELGNKSTELPTLIDWKARVLQGREVIAVNRVWDEKANDFKEVVIFDEEINGFLSSRMFKHYWREAATEFFWFWNIFPDLQKNIGGDKIKNISVFESSWCRWAKMNEQGSIHTCYVSPKWPNAKIDDPTTLTIPVVDPYSPSLMEDIQNAIGIRRFIYPVSYPSPGKSYYQLAPWDGWRTSGWPELAEMIPKAKVHLMRHLLSAKFVLEIPVNYWAYAYPDWDMLTSEQRTDIKKTKVKEVNDALTGVENTGKTILTEVIIDQNGNALPGWKIIPIEDKLRDGNFLEDSREASQHLRSALGLDSALTGDGPGKGMGSGSGSDKRIAFNIYIALQQPYREILFEPIYFIAEYNGWLKKYPNLRLKVIEVDLDTLDKAHQTSKEILN